MPTLLALAAALLFGLGDFCGGRATRHGRPFAVTFLAQLVGLAGLLCLVPLASVRGAPAEVVWWSVAAGLSGTLAGVTLYPALALGSASEVAPLSAVVGTAGPVLFGVLSGERPSALAWAGIALAALTIALVSAAGGAAASEPARRRRALLLAFVSGVFISAFLVCFERAGAEHGLAPLVLARGASLCVLGLGFALLRQAPLPPAPARSLALLTGLADTGANACYVLALASAPLATTATLANLYPAFTVLCGVFVLGERPRPVQQLGLVLALAAIALITR
ncbi:MAG: DMT family transporter [Planctomycetota bacterium]